MYRNNVILFVLTICAVADVTSAQADGLEFQSLKASYDLVENSPPATTVATFQVVANVSVAQSLLTTRIEAIVPAFIRLKPLISGPIKSGSVVTYDVQLVLDTGSTVDFEASELYTVSISISAAGGAVQKSATLQLRILNVNEPPSCENAFVQGVTVSIPENAPNGQNVYKVVAPDPEKDALFFDIVSQIPPGGPKGYFTINPASGAVERSSLSPLDYEANLRVVHLNITVRELSTQQQFTCAGSLTVNILDTNDEPPIISPLPFTQTNFAEEQPPGTPVLQVTATDRDAGDTQTYAFADTTPDAFTIAAGSGVITSSRKLDYDDALTPKFYILSIRVYDKGRTNTATATLSVFLVPVNEAPTCTPIQGNGAVANITENFRPSQTIFRVTAVDPDAGDLLTYSISNQVPPLASAEYFNIDSSSGVISRTNLVPLDYEGNFKVFLISLTITDNGSPRRSCTGRITVNLIDTNDEPPIFELVVPNPMEILEDQPPGTVITQMKATDRDAGDIVSFELASPSTAFAVDADSGIVYTQMSLDYDDAKIPKKHVLIIFAYDSGRQNVATYNLTILLQPVNEAPACDPLFAREDGAITRTAENVFPFTAIYKVTANDPDNGDILKFKITEQSPNLTAASGFFSVDPASGIVALTAKEQLNYDTGWKVFKLSLRVEEANKIIPLFCLGTLTIFVHNINDETPNIRPFISNPVSVPDTTSPGKVISKVTAVDLDENDGVFFEFIDEYKGFNIDPESGVITAAPSWERMNLDAPKSYELRIRVHDVGRIHSATTTLTVSVMDTNNNSPQCSQYVHYVSLPETAPVGGLVAQLSCWDRDGSAPNNQLLYSMQLDVSARDRFQSSGDEILIGSAGLQCDTASVANLEFKHTILMVVRDGGYPSLSTTVTVVVSVTSVNEFEPSPKNVQFSVREDSPVGELVGTVIGQDQDWPFDSLRYSIVGGNEDSPPKFFIEPTTGRLHLLNALDREKVSSYTITVQAVDVNNDQEKDPSRQKTATAVVTVIVSNVNDEPPVCTPAFYEQTIYSTLAALQSVVQMHCSDLDSSALDLTYTIIGGNTNGRFVLSNTLPPAILTRSTFSYFTLGGVTDPKDFQLLVLIEDEATKADKTRRLSSTATILIHVVPWTTTVPTPATVLTTKIINVVDTYWKPDTWFIAVMVIAGLLLLLTIALISFYCWKSMPCCWKCCKPSQPVDEKPLLEANKMEELNNTPEDPPRNTPKDPINSERTRETPPPSYGFDGRAKDPTSGREYVFNSATGERRWL
ncbi:unnamed protein product [Lampetra planeri]